MRYINNLSHKPKNYELLSRKQFKNLLGLTSADRKEYLNQDRNKHWNSLKKNFERISNNKCWYSEANASISNFYIEHFRPKKKVDLIKSKSNYPEARKETDKEGYWWLSYEYENLRLAGAKPNQIKRNYFPLIEDSKICQNKSYSYNIENPLLVDPCKKGEPKLLTFDGTIARPSETDRNNISYIRADLSITIYDLNSPRLKKARSRVYESLKNYFEQAETNFNELLTNNNLGVEGRKLAKNNFLTNCLNIISLLRPDKEFTSMIEAFLKMQSKTWVHYYILEECRKKNYIK